MAHSYNEITSSGDDEEGYDPDEFSSDDFERLKEKLTLGDALSAADVLRNEIDVHEFEKLFPQFEGDHIAFNKYRMTRVNDALIDDNLGTVLDFGASLHRSLQINPTTKVSPALGAKGVPFYKAITELQNSGEVSPRTLIRMYGQSVFGNGGN